MKAIVFTDAKGESIDMLQASAKEFKSGSTGFYAGGKVTLADGQRYQVSCSVVLVGSKPKE
jgi:dienelactone hydrolase